MEWNKTNHQIETSKKKPQFWCDFCFEVRLHGNFVTRKLSNYHQFTQKSDAFLCLNVANRKCLSINVASSNMRLSILLVLYWLLKILSTASSYKTFFKWINSSMKIVEWGTHKKREIKWMWFDWNRFCDIVHSAAELAKMFEQFHWKNKKNTHSHQFAIPNRQHLCFRFIRKICVQWIWSDSKWK